MDRWAMLTWWPVLVMGWPAVGTALVAFSVGLTSKRPAWVLAGAIVSAPFCLYVTAYPRIGALGLVVLACNFSLVWAVRNGRRLLAVALLVPFVALAAVLATIVIRQ